MRATNRRTEGLTARGMGRGAVASLPVALGVLAYGLVFGMLARQAGLGLGEVMVMSGLVFAGASQFVAVEMWGPHLDAAAIVVAVFVINLRHVLMGAAMRTWLESQSVWRASGLLFFLNDESWALSMGAYAKGERDLGFYLGSCLVMFAAWQTATLLGRLVGAALADPAALGLDFAFTAVFLALLAGLYRGKGDIPPWIVAALAALAAHSLLPGKWYILVGGLAGSLVGAWRSGGEASHGG